MVHSKFFLAESRNKAQVSLNLYGLAGKTSIFHFWSISQHLIFLMFNLRTLPKKTGFSDRRSTFFPHHSSVIHPNFPTSISPLYPHFVAKFPKKIFCWWSSSSFYRSCHKYINEVCPLVMGVALILSILMLGFSIRKTSQLLGMRPLRG